MASLPLGGVGGGPFSFSYFSYKLTSFFSNSNRCSPKNEKKIRKGEKNMNSSPFFVAFDSHYKHNQ